MTSRFSNKKEPPPPPHASSGGNSSDIHHLNSSNTPSYHHQQHYHSHSHQGSGNKQPQPLHSSTSEDGELLSEEGEITHSSNNRMTLTPSANQPYHQSTNKMGSSPPLNSSSAPSRSNKSSSYSSYASLVSTGTGNMKNSSVNATNNNNNVTDWRESSRSLMNNAHDTMSYDNSRSMSDSGNSSSNTTNNNFFSSSSTSSSSAPLHSNKHDVSNSPSSASKSSPSPSLSGPFSAAPLPRGRNRERSWSTVSATHSSSGHNIRERDSERDIRDNRGDRDLPTSRKDNNMRSSFSREVSDLDSSRPSYSSIDKHQDWDRGSSYSRDSNNNSRDWDSNNRFAGGSRSKNFRDNRDRTRYVRQQTYPSISSTTSYNKYNNDRDNRRLPKWDRNNNEESSSYIDGNKNRYNATGSNNVSGSIDNKPMKVGTYSSMAANDRERDIRGRDDSYRPTKPSFSYNPRRKSDESINVVKKNPTDYFHTPDDITDKDNRDTRDHKTRDLSQHDSAESNWDKSRDPRHRDTFFSPANTSGEKTRDNRDLPRDPRDMRPRSKRDYERDNTFRDRKSSFSTSPPPTSSNPIVHGVPRSRSFSKPVRSFADGDAGTSSTLDNDYSSNRWNKTNRGDFSSSNIENLDDNSQKGPPYKRARVGTISSQTDLNRGAGRFQWKKNKGPNTYSAIGNSSSWKNNDDHSSSSYSNKNEVENSTKPKYTYQSYNSNTNDSSSSYRDYPSSTQHFQKAKDRFSDNIKRSVSSAAAIPSTSSGTPASHSSHNNRMKRQISPPVDPRIAMRKQQQHQQQDETQSLSYSRRHSYDAPSKPYTHRTARSNSLFGDEEEPSNTDTSLTSTHQITPKEDIKPLSSSPTKQNQKLNLKKEPWNIGDNTSSDHFKSSVPLSSSATRDLKENEPINKQTVSPPLNPPPLPPPLQAPHPSIPPSSKKVIKNQQTQQKQQTQMCTPLVEDPRKQQDKQHQPRKENIKEQPPLPPKEIIPPISNKLSITKTIPSVQVQTQSSIPESSSDKSSSSNVASNSATQNSFNKVTSSSVAATVPTSAQNPSSPVLAPVATAPASPPPPPLTCASLGSADKVNKAEQALHKLVFLNPSFNVNQSNDSLHLPTKAIIIKAISSIDQKIKNHKSVITKNKETMVTLKEKRQLESRFRQNMLRYCERALSARHKSYVDTQDKVSTKEREKVEIDGFHKKEEDKLSSSDSTNSSNGETQDEDWDKEIQEKFNFLKTKLASIQPKISESETQTQLLLRQDYSNKEELALCKTKLTDAISEYESRVGSVKDAVVPVVTQKSSRKKNKHLPTPISNIQIKSLVKNIIQENRDRAASAQQDSLSLIPLSSGGNEEYNALTRQVTGQANALYTEPSDSPFFHIHSKSVGKVRSAVRSRIRSTKKKLNRRWEQLGHEYMVRQKQYMKKQKKSLGVKKKSDECTDSDPILSPNQRSHQSIMGDSPSEESITRENRSTQHPYRRPRRSLNNQNNTSTNGDIVRSEYEQEQIIAEITAKEAMEKRIATGGCSLPRQRCRLELKLGILYRDDQRNRRVLDPASLEEEESKINPWTDIEKCIFLDRFLQDPKNFSKIASVLRNKSTKDCVNFYYSSKQIIPYKQALREYQMRKKRRYYYSASSDLNSQHHWEATIQAALSVGATVTKGTSSEKPLVFSLPRSDNTFDMQLLHPFKKELFTPSLDNDVAHYEKFKSKDDLSHKYSFSFQNGHPMQIEAEDDDASVGSTSINSSNKKDASKTPTEKKKKKHKNSKTKWTNVEKKLLREALSKYGDDWDNVASHIGSKNVTQVKTFYNMHSSKYEMAMRLTPPVQEQTGVTGNEGLRDQQVNEENKDMEDKDLRNDRTSSVEKEVATHTEPEDMMLSDNDTSIHPAVSLSHSQNIINNHMREQQTQHNPLDILSQLSTSIHQSQQSHHHHPLLSSGAVDFHAVSQTNLNAISNAAYSLENSSRHAAWLQQQLSESQNNAFRHHHRLMQSLPPASATLPSYGRLSHPSNPTYSIGQHHHTNRDLSSAHSHILDYYTPQSHHPTSWPHYPHDSSRNTNPNDTDFHNN